ncbi:TMEM143 family protein [Hyphomicrobium sp.]|uniref:TMEM143 family protein n=1 Tax=Hyphomicrobium sp. TaxID=82 RepID=UPI000F9D7138|nr:TMEM143 family protein [Hyphomicrobium sp.]RUP08703.1 MAG: DUF3754 domain-containing protein [Hyphomicrobium sp.]
MASADFAAGRLQRREGLFQRLADLTDFEAKPAELSEDAEHRPIDILEPDDTRKRERFIPVTRFALLDRLTKPYLWPAGQAAEARRFFRYLDYWRQQQYFALLLDLEQTYEAFSPDSDLLMTRSFSDDEREVLKHRVFEGVEALLERANYERIEPSNIELIMTPDSHYGLDLFVDMKEFERISIFYRGASNRKYERRRLRKFLRKEEFDVPIFQRLFLMFKLKPVEACVEEAMRDLKLSRDAAETYVAKARAHFPKSMNDKNIYLKLFKNIPRTDVEMIFPNTKVRFRPMDKLRLGVTAGGGIGMGAAGAAGKVALLMSNPIAALGALAGLGGIAARQAMGFLNQKQRYMVIMAQNLYFHTMADNRGVILKIAARGAEEDVKEEMLLYSVLAKEKSTRTDLPSIDLAIENYLTRTFGVKIDFEIDDALDRLIRDGIVVEKPDGSFVTLPPAEAAKHIDAKWDLFLDHLPDPVSTEGYEFEGRPA